MSADVTATFMQSLAALGVEWTQTPVDEFETVLRELATAPVVGARVPYDGVQLADMDGLEIETDPSLTDLRAATTGVTAAAFAIADYGSTVFRTDTQPVTEHVSLFIDEHIVVLPKSRVKPDMAAAVAELGPLCREEGASSIIATGPSATADMGALVQGAHGPETVHVVVLTDR